MQTITKTGKSLLQGILLGALLILPVFMIFVGISLIAGAPIFTEETGFVEVYETNTAKSIIRPLIMFALVFRFMYRLPIRPSYQAWFKTLPWQPGDPLPAGDLNFSLRIFVALIFAAFLGSILFNIQWWVIPTYAIAVQLGLSVIALWFSKRFWPISYAVIISSFIYYLYTDFNWHTALIAGILYFPLSILLHRSLAETIPYAENRIDKPTTKTPWPASDLMHFSKTLNVWTPRTGESHIVCVLVATIALAIIRDDPASTTLVLALAAAFVVIRSITFVCRKAPSVSLVGRLVNGPLLIPKYDRVFLPILLTVAVYSIGWFLHRWVPENQQEYLQALIVFAVMWIGLNTFPRLRYWNLIAPGRFTSFG